MRRIRKFIGAENLKAVFTKTAANNRKRTQYLGLIFRIESNGGEARDFRVLQLVGGGVDFRYDYVFAILEFFSQLWEQKNVKLVTERWPSDELTNLKLSSQQEFTIFCHTSAQKKLKFSLTSDFFWAVSTNMHEQTDDTLTDAVGVQKWIFQIQLTILGQ